MGVIFEVPGWKEFTERCQGVVDSFEAKKLVLMRRMSNICLEEISPLIPVDTSRLVSSFQVGVITPDEAEIGTNVEYAIYVNDGHVQHKRFLPISYLSAGGRGKYIKPGNTKGIMLKEKYVPGKHFLENGMRQAEPRLKSIGESFMRDRGRWMI